MPSFRIHIDETGNISENATNDPLKRFVSITGVIFEEDYHDGQFTEAFNALRVEHFGRDGEGRPHHLHRRMIIKAVPPFQSLTDPERRAAWERDFLQFVGDSNMHVITSCLDKVAFYFRFPAWTKDPYELCFLTPLSGSITFYAIRTALAASQ